MRRSAIALIAAAVLVQTAVAVGLIIAFFTADGAGAQTVRNYDLEIVATDIDYGNGNIWHAWTFKLAGEPAGTIPGPTITANVGDKIRVHITNELDLVHSFHSHLTGYDMASDGSQANIIADVGAGAMIPPGGEYTYEFEATEAGIFYYHCHSADGGLMITERIHQGLYGAIVVAERDEPPVRDEVIFMAEGGHLTEGDSVPFFLMNGLGLPGGEHALEAAFHEGGFDAVAAQLNKTVPAISATVGEPLRVHVINIGDQIHSFHPHNVPLISLEALDGRRWPANVLPLLPGAADTLLLEFSKPGLWLFHCHVVGHADAGMIGVFIIEEEGAARPEPTQASPGVDQPTPSRAPPTPTAGATSPATASLRLEQSEWQITGAGGSALPEVVAGDVAMEVRNRGSVPHELAVIRTDAQPDALPVDGGAVDEDAAGELMGRIPAVLGGATKRDTFTLTPGNYVLICNIPGHYQQGMHTRLVVR